MRYADFAYDHVASNPRDPKRKAKIDQKAKDAGFSKPADYVDHVQGRPDTKSMKGGQGRVMWANEKEGLRGINNKTNPERSTVIPTRNSDRELKNFRKREAGRPDLGKDALKEKGPIRKADRTIDPKTASAAKQRQAAQQKSPTPAKAPHAPTRANSPAKTKPAPKRPLPPRQPPPQSRPKNRSR